MEQQGADVPDFQPEMDQEQTRSALDYLKKNPFQFTPEQKQKVAHLIHAVGPNNTGTGFNPEYKNNLQNTISNIFTSFTKYNSRGLLGNRSALLSSPPPKKTLYN